MATQAYDRISGWVEFAAIVMFAVGFSLIIAAIGYFADVTIVNLAPWYGAIAITLGVLVIYGLARSPREAYQ